VSVHTRALPEGWGGLDAPPSPHTTVLHNKHCGINSGVGRGGLGWVGGLVPVMSYVFDAVAILAQALEAPDIPGTENAPLVAAQLAFSGLFGE
jgi:hypothetical protein